MNFEQMSREELIERLQQQQADAGATDRVVHDLRVHQTELEVQNRELRDARSALEESRSRYSDLYDFAPVAYFTFDEKGLITEINLTGATMLRRDRAHLMGLPFLSCVRMAEPARFWSHLRECLKERRSVLSEMSFSVDSHRIEAQVVSVPVFDASGRPVAFRTAFSDISRLKHTEAELVRANEREQSLHRRYEALDGAQAALAEVLARTARASLDDVLRDAVVERARALTDAEFGALALGTAPDRPLRLIASA